MRTEKELLQLLLDNIDLLETGFILLTHDLHKMGKIRKKERFFINDFIGKQLTISKSEYFYRGEKETHIKWLKEQIKQLEK